ncbi:hypothetical protein [Pendulispora albinea]|uniref:Uncharacterized protein n=1 Tax=Pendulispora albinea TaxID=2741071 RepID=A0ABZ2LZA7_9BACT
MKKIVFAFVTLLAPLMACSAETASEAPGSDEVVAPQEGDTQNQSIDVEAAASCGIVNLEYCRDPRFPSQITASCYPQRRCSCAAEIDICKSLVREYCGKVENIVVRNCDRP